ncbi:hypothetical protein RSOLAG22IIIB_11691 [Rhizoctonia solani]|uniref:Uncharacterized protein n=1 Tax=Rhizoctonia solani TaxID=456999 RepID=A0A0K6GAF5_9AGAM|nr:hypothetical protein RSOLAG22IIIB_11691 [Rhizoctonia solani]
MLFTPLLALATYASAAPAGLSASASTSTPPSLTPSSTSTSDASLPSPTVASASDDPNGSLLNQYQNGTPESERGTAGASILGPQNISLEQESPSFMAPPPTDSGSMWPFALSHNRVQDGGWARQQNDHDMSLATMAGLNMCLTAGGIRTQETCGTSQGESRTPSKASTIAPKDVLDDGTFSEDSTFLRTDWMAHRSLATNTTGGTVEVIDSPRCTFNIPHTIAIAEITVMPGGIRESHVRLATFINPTSGTLICRDFSKVASGTARMDFLPTKQRYLPLRLTLVPLTTKPEIPARTISQLQKVKPVVAGPGEW